MYSFAQRPDTSIVDEPLYGHYLRVSGAVHPGGDEVMRAMNCDGDAVIRSLLGSERPHLEVLFIKHMAHHLLELDLSFLSSTQNVFLIRDPGEMLPSLTVQIPHAGLADTGLKRQWEVYRSLQSQGQSPAIIDARELLLDPGGVISALCLHLGIDFYSGMLSWPAGPVKEDGIWARHWYQAVHKSTGFANYVAKEDFPESLKPLLDECRPYYENLYAQSIKAQPSRDIQS
jgi:hypothetical protein